jgi:hypothetical protein
MSVQLHCNYNSTATLHVKHFHFDCLHSLTCCLYLVFPWCITRFAFCRALFPRRLLASPARVACSRRLSAHFPFHSLILSVFSRILPGLPRLPLARGLWPVLMSAASSRLSSCLSARLPSCLSSCLSASDDLSRSCLSCSHHRRQATEAVCLCSVACLPLLCGLSASALCPVFLWPLLRPSLCVWQER